MLKTAIRTLVAAQMLVGLPAMAAETPLEKAIDSDYGYLHKLFIHFHENPELSFEEHKTSAKLAEELKSIGYDVTTGVGGTGVVAILKNGDGPTVMVRADMDGLPLTEKSGLSYASHVHQVDADGKTFPVMHACGHDVHITSLIGTARRMAAMKDKWQGTLMLIGQPAEERIGGAKAMLKDGLFKRFPVPTYALAFHVNSQLPTGHISYKSGIMYSSSDSVRITIHGIGTHGAAPDKGKDPIVLGAEIVGALQTLVSREISPLDPGVVTVGTFNAGTKNNIISDKAVLTLTVRSNSEDVRHKLLQGIKRIAENAGRMAGLPENLLPAVELSIESAPTTINDPALTAKLDKVFKAKLGADKVIPYVQRNMGAEDFSYFVQTPEHVPGFYYQVGGTPQAAFDAEKAGGPAVPAHHSPLFKIAPEGSIKMGVESMTIAAMNLMPKH